MVNILITQDGCNCGCFTFQDISTPEDLSQLCNCDDGEQWRTGVTKTDFVLTAPNGSVFEFDKGYLPGGSPVTICSDDLSRVVSVDPVVCGCEDQVEVTEKKLAAFVDGCYTIEYRQYGYESSEVLFQDYSVSFKSSKLATQKLWVEKNGVWTDVTTSSSISNKTIVFTVTNTKDVYTKAQLRTDDRVDSEQYFIGYNDYLQFVANTTETVMATKTHNFTLWCNTTQKLANAINKINTTDDCANCVDKKARNYDLMVGWIQLENLKKECADCSCISDFSKYIDQIVACE